VIRVDGEYAQHAHIKALITCNTLITLLHNNKLPASKYLQGSARRLLTEEEYKMLKPKKQQYYNINKGVR
jgi:hypothetical protein